MAEPDYKDLLRRYVLHVCEYTEEHYLDLSLNWITPEEVIIIKELIGEPTNETDTSTD